MYARFLFQKMMLWFVIRALMVVTSGGLAYGGPAQGGMLNFDACYLAFFYAIDIVGDVKRSKGK